MKGLGVRVASGAVLLVLVLAAIWLQGLLLMGAVAVATALAAHEFYTMTRHAGYAPWYPAGVALAILLALRSYLGGDVFTGSAYTGPSAGAEAIIVALVLVLALGRLGLEWQRAPLPAPQPMGTSARPGTPAGMRGSAGWADVGVTLGGAMYTGGLLGFAPLLAALPATASQAGGVWWLLLVIVGTAACDTGAYLVGSMLGRHKLIPHISPGKTWEGLAGGVLGAVIAALALSGLLKLEVWEATILGLLVCIAAVGGDLCESLIKRAVGVKDSSHLIPGHGGLLDRLDSILFVLLAVYWFTRAVL